MSTLEKVLEVLKNSKEPLKAGDIAELAGIDKAEVDKAIKELKKEEKITSPKRCFYSVNQ
ncbi:HTH domain-containing protein [Desnuesiella massiliensis]|uniref:HTH domain-containing protein n=1 Tax=Desnuesiella massiliensis TaxID=1650662 RepID=UPI0006E16CAC|nr:HTH domain-containing protein [Desnuesiella massiliensis]